MTIQETTLVESRMSTELKTLRPNDNLAKALLLVCSEDIRHLPVLENDRLVGLLSDRDVKRNLPTKGQDVNLWNHIEEVKIESIMTRHVRTVKRDVDLKHAAMIMLREKINALPVVDDDNKLEGIITTEDILWAFITED